MQAFFFGKTSHQPSLSAPLQPRFGSLRLLVSPRAKIAFESKEICEFGGSTIHKLSQRRLTADWLAPRKSDCSRMRSKVSSDWLSSRIKATRPVIEIFIMTAFFPDRPRIYRASQEECARLRESVPYVKVYRYNPKHLCPKLNGYGDNGQRKVWSSGGSTHCTCQLTTLSMSVLECGVILRQFRSSSL